MALRTGLVGLVLLSRLGFWPGLGELRCPRGWPCELGPWSAAGGGVDQQCSRGSLRALRGASAGVKQST